MKIQPKQLRWLGDSLEDVKAFSDEAKRSAGHQLGLVQAGLDPLDWALVALTLTSSIAFAHGDKNGYLLDSNRDVVRSGFGLCWHTGFWTPADAIEECDAGLVKREEAAAPSAARRPCSRGA